MTTENNDRDYSYLTAASGPSKAEQQAATDDAMQRFLAAGGKIQQLDYRQSGRTEGDGYNPWGAGRKKKSADAAPAAAEEDSADE